LTLPKRISKNFWNTGVALTRKWKMGRTGRTEALTDCPTQLDEVQGLFTPEQWRQLVAEVQRSLAETEVPSVLMVHMQPWPWNSGCKWEWKRPEPVCCPLWTHCRHDQSRWTCCSCILCWSSNSGNVLSHLPVWIQCHHGHMSWGWCQSPIHDIWQDQNSELHDIMSAEWKARKIVCTNAVPAQSLFAFKDEDDEEGKGKRKNKGKTTLLDNAQLANFDDPRASFGFGDKDNLSCAAPLKSFFIQFL